jgi:type VI secretion system protein ImpA
MINVDELLQPTPTSPPCGEDYSYNEKFMDLERLAEGKKETVMGNETKPAEDPNWKEVSDKAIEVLKESKHLRAAALLATSLVKMGGVEGLRDGLAVMHGLTERYWGDIYPKLDPGDNNDPTERLNIIGSLSSPKFATDMRKIVICATPMVRITMQDVIAAKASQGDKTQATGGSGMGLSQIEGVLRDLGPAKASATLGLVNEAITHAKGIEGFLDTTLGVGNGVNFETLNKLLADMKQTVEPYATDGATGAAAAPSDGSPAGVTAPQAAQGVSGGIRNSADVTKALDLICDYYKDHEPSSPVPLILQRAQRLVNKDFTAIMSDLTPDALRQLEVITGKPNNE